MINTDSMKAWHTQCQVLFPQGHGQLGFGMKVGPYRFIFVFSPFLYLGFYVLGDDSSNSVSEPFVPQYLSTVYDVRLKHNVLAVE